MYVVSLNSKTLRPNTSSKRFNDTVPRSQMMVVKTINDQRIHHIRYYVSLFCRVAVVGLRHAPKNVAQ